MNSPASGLSILFGALALALTACGTGEDPTLLPEQTGPPPSLEALRSRADDATLALNEDRWLDLYEFKSPRSVRPRLPYGLPAVQLCTQEQFIFDTGTRIAKIRALAGLYRDEKLTWEIVDVKTKEGDDSVRHGDRIGVVRLDIYHEGKLVTDEFHDYRGEVEEGERWVYIDGEWWMEPENWVERCHENTLFGL